MNPSSPRPVKQKGTTIQVESRNLRTLKQFAAENPAFPKKTLQNMVFLRHKNGFEAAFLKINGRRLVDVEAFNCCLVKLSRPERPDNGKS